MLKLEGNTSKDSGYLRRIKEAIADQQDHPRNKGVRMQAHHLISAKGMHDSGLSTKIKGKGYNINLLPNLVFLPCTLQGACHMGIQPHRGNHNAVVDEDDYLDDSEVSDYHRIVSKKIADLGLTFPRTCKSDAVLHARDVVSKLDLLSKQLLVLIKKKPGSAPLTKIARHFNNGEVGCSGADSLANHKKDIPCSVERNHLRVLGSPTVSQKRGQAREKIAFENPEKYRFTVGK